MCWGRGQLTRSCTAHPLLIIPQRLPFQSLGELIHLLCLALWLKLLSLPGGCLHGEATTPHSPHCLPRTRSQRFTPLFLLRNTEQQSLYHVVTESRCLERNFTLLTSPLSIPTAQPFCWATHWIQELGGCVASGRNINWVGRISAASEKRVSKSWDEGTSFSEGQPFSQGGRKESSPLRTALEGGDLILLGHEQAPISLPHSAEQPELGAGGCAFCWAVFWDHPVS